MVEALIEVKMKFAVVVIVLTGVAIFVNELYHRDKARRDKEKALEEAVRNEKRRRMGSFTNDDFWN